MSSTDQCRYYLLRAQLKFFDFVGICPSLIIIQILDDNLGIYRFLNRKVHLQTTFIQITIWCPLETISWNTHSVKEFCRRTGHWVLANTVGLSLLVSLTHVSSFTREIHAGI